MPTPQRRALAQAVPVRPALGLEHPHSHLLCDPLSSCRTRMRVGPAVPAVRGAAPICRWGQGMLQRLVWRRCPTACRRAHQPPVASASACRLRTAPWGIVRCRCCIIITTTRTPGTPAATTRPRHRAAAAGQPTTLVAWGCWVALHRAPCRRVFACRAGWTCMQGTANIISKASSPPVWAPRMSASSSARAACHSSWMVVASVSIEWRCAALVPARVRHANCCHTPVSLGLPSTCPTLVVEWVGCLAEFTRNLTATCCRNFAKPVKLYDNR